MTEQELRQVLAGKECEIAEYKPALLRRREIAEYAVGIGNAGGGSLVMGVSDKPPHEPTGQPHPDDQEIAGIRSSVADSAGIHIGLDVVDLPGGSVVVVRIPNRPRGDVFHTSDGTFVIRVGDQLRGMTVEEIEAIRREAGVEPTAERVTGSPAELVSAVAMEGLRRLMEEAGAAADLVRQSDIDLLRALGVVSGDGQLLVAGLLLAGKPETIRNVVPYAQWQFRRMKSDTEYDQADDGCDCIPVALRRLRELVGANNPIVTIPGWLVQPEFPRYPMMALRELVVNALAHRDYRVPGAVVLKLYPDRLELSNPGGFVGGVTPENILHHPSTPRNLALFQALTRMRLANAANLGVPRVYRDLLSEGKEPPVYWASEQAVRVTVKGQEARREFLQLVKENPGLDTDHLLVLHYLTRHREITVHTAAGICQRPVEVTRETLGQLVTQRRLLEPCGAGKGRYYRLSLSTYNVLLDVLSYHLDGRVTRETARVSVLKALRAGPLTNAQVRELTGMDRNHAWALMHELSEQGLAEPSGHGRGSIWILRPKSNNAD